MSTPALIMLIGRPGSGKSYLGRLIAARLGLPIIQTDLIRKRLFPEPRYTGPESGAVYDEAHRRLRLGLRAGQSLIFDATNLSERQRRNVYQIADQARAGLVLVLAVAPTEVIHRRLDGRQVGLDPLDQSEADWQIYRKMGPSDPIARPHLVINTALELNQAVEVIAARAM